MIAGGVLTGTMPRPRDDGTKKGPTRMVRVSERLMAILDQIAEKNVTTGPIEANRLIREGLERLGLWPPQESSRGRK